MNSSSLPAIFRRLLPAGRPRCVLPGLCVAAALSLWGSVEVHRQIASALPGLEVRCSKIPAAADGAPCTSVAQTVSLLERRSAGMLALQGLCFALIAAGALSLRRALQGSARPGTESVHPALPCAETSEAGPGKEAVRPAPVPEPDALAVLAPILAGCCESDMTRTRLLAALAHFQSSLGAARVSLHLESAVCQPLGSAALLCVPPEASEGLPPAEPLEAGAPPLACGAPGEAGPLRIPLSCGGLSIGLLVVEPAAPPQARERLLRLSRAFADLVALAIAGVCRRHEDRRMALMEERSAIAGELHDSLSQALAFLKIQVAQLQRAMGREGLRPEFVEAAGELRHGLSAAYRQVRELIAAFRVRIAPGGLVAAVEETIEDLGRHGGLDIAFEHDFSACRLEADEEFHVMQIIRESLFNTIRHAGATQAWVSIRYAADAHLLRVHVEDDGRGLCDLRAGGSHHGLSVMQQRARSLQGGLELQPRPGGGTVVQLSFAPQRLAAAGNHHGTPP